MIHSGSLPVSREGHDLIMRGLAMIGDPHAIEIFEAIVQRGTELPEGALVTLISICAESQNVRFAESVLSHAKARGTSTMPMFSAMMKVYLQARQADKACDLY